VTYAFFDHTGDIGVTLDAATLPDLFRSAVEALADVTSDTTLVESALSVPVELSAPALDLLLADWLREAVYQIDAQGFVLRSGRAEVEETDSGWRLFGVLEGEPLDPARHHVKVLVKAVTYHRLEVTRTSAGWTATVIFDI
jgi:protein archease